MKLHHIHTSIVLVLLATLPIAAQTGTRTIDLKEITDGVFAPKRAGQKLKPMSDGRYYTSISQNGKAILKYSYETEEPIDTLFNTQTARNCTFDTIEDYLISNSGHHIIILRNRTPIYRRSASYDAYHYDVRRNLIAPLSEREGQIRIPTLSPDGRMCAYVLGNNIYIKKFDYNTDLAVTTDGKINHILNGVTDWVYEEELYTTRLLVWSTESDYLAFVQTDESEVKTFEIPIYGEGSYPQIYRYKYPKAGEKNSKTCLMLYNLANRNTREISLPTTIREEELYIPRLEFIGEHLYTYTLNRHQNHFRLYRTNPKSEVTTVWIDQKDERYIDDEWLRQWVIFQDESGSIGVSEESGRPQLYQYDANGSCIKQLTRGDFDVIHFYGKTNEGHLIFQAATPTPMDRVILSLDTKGKVSPLSPDQGTSAAAFSNDFSYYILSHSASDQVPLYEIRRTRDAKSIRVLERNQELARRLQEYRFSIPEKMQLSTDTGQTLNAWIRKPSTFDPNRKYPVVITQYSGPGSQSVLNRYEFDWTAYLVEQGFLVVSIDPRGTGARGADFKKCTYLAMGLKESDDLIASARALQRLPYVEASRIGVYGWSFGGYMTLMCMMRGEGVFAAGVAIAPPTDWRYYDTIYTERFMRTPQENPQGYKETSTLTHADKLQGKLLIIHGTMDDNVHLQNSMQITSELVRRGKDFDMMIYPDRDHSIYGGNTRLHLFQKVIRHFTEHLK